MCSGDGYIPVASDFSRGTSFAIRDLSCATVDLLLVSVDASADLSAVACVFAHVSWIRTASSCFILDCNSDKSCFCWVFQCEVGATCVEHGDETNAVVEGQLAVSPKAEGCFWNPARTGQHESEWGGGWTK